MRILWTAAAALALLGLAAGSAAARMGWSGTQAAGFQSQPDAKQGIDKARANVAAWPEDARLLARKMIDEIGAPDEVMPRHMTWSGRKPFNTITVYSDKVSSGQAGLLLETVSYRVPVGKWRALNAFGHGVTYDVVFNELVACSDAPETNLLALNLADEVIQGRRSPDEARAVFDKTLTRSYAGKSSWYLSGLQFKPSERKK